VDDDRAVTRDIGQPFAQRVQRPVQAAVDRLLRAFTRRTDIDNERRIRPGDPLGSSLRTETVR